MSTKQYKALHRRTLAWSINHPENRDFFINLARIIARVEILEMANTAANKVIGDQATELQGIIFKLQARLDAANEIVTAVANLNLANLKQIHPWDETQREAQRWLEPKTPRKRRRLNIS